MEDTSTTWLREEFHKVNNWLNKITILSGQARYELETKGIDSERLEDEKKRFMELLDNFEDYALKIGQILMALKKQLTKR